MGVMARFEIYEYQRCKCTSTSTDNMYEYVTGLPNVQLARAWLARLQALNREYSYVLVLTPALAYPYK